MANTRDVYLDAASAVVELLSKPEIEANWDNESVLEGFKVSALAGHLARSISLVHEYLEATVSGIMPVDAEVYIADMVEAVEVDPRLNEQIRERGAKESEGGPDKLVEQAANYISFLNEEFLRVASDRRVQVFKGRVMLLDEYLKTRLVEMVVYVEDLALSVGAGVGLPTEAMSIATDVVANAGRIRHGDLAFLRAMTRRERDDVEATRVL